MHYLKLASVVALLTIVTACGDDDDTDPAVGKCNDLASLICTRLADCGVEGGLIDASERTSTYNDCFSDAKETIECDRAVDVSETYDQCVEDVDSAPCEIVNDPDVGLPASCMESILVR